MIQEKEIVKSPLTNGATVKVVEIEVSKLISGYQNEYNIDVKEIFAKNKNICLYRCLDSNYRFYYPYTLSGDFRFYEQLAIYDWYYIPWKWEHEKSIPFVKNAQYILEIGCGSGSFLKEINKRYPDKVVKGLEITIGENQEEFILNETIEEHSKLNAGKYDLVCFYQVLEHIADTKSFLEASLKVLKPGGEMIICVPNNESFLLNAKSNNFLNMPPHHMGLWDNHSLQFLCNHFSLEIVKRFYEPIQNYHFDWFKNIIIEKLRNTNSSILFRLSSNKILINMFANILRKFYRGHSIMFVYRKSS